MDLCFCSELLAAQDPPRLFMESVCAFLLHGTQYLWLSDRGADLHFEQSVVLFGSRVNFGTAGLPAAAR